MALSRFVHDSGLTVLWGGLGFPLVVNEAVGRHVASALQQPASASVALILVTSTIALPIQAAMITNLWSSVFDKTTLLLVAETASGQALAIQCATALALLAAHLARSTRATVGLSGLMLCQLATVGHSSEESGSSGFFHQLVDIVHVLSGTAWVGALLAFLLLIRLAKEEELRRASIAAMRTFSFLGHIAVILVIVSGLANTWLTVGRVPDDLSRPYDVKLLAKMAVVAMMAALAICNRYVLVPGLRGPDCHRTRELLVAGCLGEILLGVATLGLVASFGLEDPS